MDFDWTQSNSAKFALLEILSQRTEAVGMKVCGWPYCAAHATESHGALALGTWAQAVTNCTVPDPCHVDFFFGLSAKVPARQAGCASQLYPEGPIFFLVLRPSEILSSSPLSQPHSKSIHNCHHNHNSACAGNLFPLTSLCTVPPVPSVRPQHVERPRLSHPQQTVTKQHSTQISILHFTITSPAVSESNHLR